MRSLTITLFAVGAFVCSGCASVVTGTDQKVTFNSEPDGASVIVSGRALGKTPLTVDVDKGKNQSFSFQKEGYKEHVAHLSTSTTSWFFGNILLGGLGLVGSTTDGVSGAIYEFSPDQYFVTLTPDTASGISTSNRRRIKEIIIAFSDEFRHQLASGGGEYVNAVLKLIKVNVKDGDTTIRVLNRLALENDDDLKLAEKIIDLYDVS